MRESTVPVSADKYDLKLLPRLFDGSIWFHQDPCQTTTRRALTNREKEGRRMWMREHTVHKHDCCWSGFHCFGYFQTLSLPNTSSLSNSFFQIQPGSLLNANHAVILHLECVCCSVGVCVCVFGEPPLSPGRGSSGMAGIKMTSECHGRGKENRPVLTSSSSLSCSLYPLRQRSHWWGI